MQFLEQAREAAGTPMRANIQSILERNNGGRMFFSFFKLKRKKKRRNEKKDGQWPDADCAVNVNSCARSVRT